MSIRLLSRKPNDKHDDAHNSRDQSGEIFRHLSPFAKLQHVQRIAGDQSHSIRVASGRRSQLSVYMGFATGLDPIPRRTPGIRLREPVQEAVAPRLSLRNVCLRLHSALASATNILRQDHLDPGHAQSARLSR